MTAVTADARLMFALESGIMHMSKMVPITVRSGITHLENGGPR